jgi:hypothetical protein
MRRYLARSSSPRACGPSAGGAAVAALLSWEWRQSVPNSRLPRLRSSGRQRMASARLPMDGHGRQNEAGDGAGRLRQDHDRSGDYVRMLGSMIASSAVRVMRESIEPVGTARIWAGQETFPCPGRVRAGDPNHHGDPCKRFCECGLHLPRQSLQSSYLSGDRLSVEARLR